MSQDYVWPLSNSTTPDEMNTSFGPRINEDRWDFHDGIDLPAPGGTRVHAMRAGRCTTPARADRAGISSRHVVVKVDDPTDGPIYNVYLHLNSIDPAVVTGGERGSRTADRHRRRRRRDLLVTCTWSSGRARSRQIGSVHPLTYLPYTDTANFSAACRRSLQPAGRIHGRAPALRNRACKLEGDLRRVEVDLRRGTRVLTTRVVDFDDKHTVNEEKGDRFLFVDDIGVEGYQKSNMVKHGRNDLAYGILVRRIPRRCDTLVARVFDVGGNVVTSAVDRGPGSDAGRRIRRFRGRPTPAGRMDEGHQRGRKRDGGVRSKPPPHTRGRVVCDASTTRPPRRTRSARASPTPLPPDRFEWRAQAWFNPIDLGLAHRISSVYLLYFLSGTNLSVAARIRNDGGTFRAGLVAKNPDDKFVSDDGATHRGGQVAQVEIGTAPGGRPARRPRSCISTTADA